MSAWNLSGKVAIVTGANSGIGLETVKLLLDAGCRVVMACRDVDKGKMSGLCENERCSLIKLDLASFKSIKDFAEQVINEFKEIHILVNNAGVFHSKRILTEDDFEIHFGVNHLGHFLLTRLLLKKMISSAPSRIINISSKAHEYSAINFHDLETKQEWNPLKAYSRSKTANILFTAHLAAILGGTGVTAYSVHPGVVETNLGRHLEGTCFMRLFHCLLFVSRKKMIQPQLGAATTYYCCSDQLLTSQTGLYYSDCKRRRPKKHATDPLQADQLWKISCSLTGLPNHI